MGKLIRDILGEEAIGLVSLDGENHVPKTFGELGKCVGVGKTTISAYELGKVSPDLEKLEMMCDRLGVDSIAILTEARDQYVKETSK